MASLALARYTNPTDGLALIVLATSTALSSLRPSSPFAVHLSLHPSHPSRSCGIWPVSTCAELWSTEASAHLCNPALIHVGMTLNHGMSFAARGSMMYCAHSVVSSFFGAE